jgi:hypothetical protein
MAAILSLQNHDISRLERLIERITDFIRVQVGHVQYPHQVFVVLAAIPYLDVCPGLVSMILPEHVQVLQGGQYMWLAIPIMPVKKGDILRFNDVTAIDPKKRSCPQITQISAD